MCVSGIFWLSFIGLEFAYLQIVKGQKRSSPASAVAAVAAAAAAAVAASTAGTDLDYE
jgi:hypothetical protein